MRNASPNWQKKLHSHEHFFTSRFHGPPGR
ncbi:hypothetical protein SAMN05216193_103322 [Pseudomonas jinjuensis]|uniref:Uncharacterized protein n=1 Tax=Pseudomonas jinjuensis TaxID=198616 RepID=A0A1H0C629_9PSED|nr:hypothetical protein SAMN05216193_103322 [Pseudomonas jinjuensis]